MKNGVGLASKKAAEEQPHILRLGRSTISFRMTE
jgi:hypothetical protein